MPLEDVDFMKSNAEIDSRMIFIDSSKRDKQTYPYPHNYTVSFNDPFTNVCGIEILDAMIISTMYNVEYFNNWFKYHQIFLQQMSITDNSLSEFFIELNNNKQFNELLNVKHNNRAIIMEFNDSLTQTIVDLSTFVQGDILVSLYVRRIISILKKYDITATINYDNTKYVYVTDISYIYVLEKNDESIYLLKNGGYTIYESYIVYYNTYNYDINNYDEIYNLTIDYQLFVIHNAIVTIKTGNYDIRSLKDEINIMLSSNNDIEPWAYKLPFFENSISISNANKVTNIERNMKYEFNIPIHERNRILIIPDSCGMKDLFGLNIPKPLNIVKGYNVIKLGSKVGFISIYSSDGSGDSILTCPGVVNFTSNIRYMLLRCPEIESHLHNSFSTSGFCTGIGLFKHTGNYDQNNYRFDFINFNKKPFHPIGKLSKMTLSFELPDGTPYDFKGVDHILLLLIKYYNPTLKSKITNNFSLNPDYNPDFLNYMIERNKVKANVNELLYSELNYNNNDDNDDDIDDDNDDDGFAYDYEEYSNDNNDELNDKDIDILKIKQFLNEKNKYDF